MRIKFSTYYDNQIDPFIPEWWANETLVLLEENMIAAQMVNRDFEPYFNKFGDIVNTRRPRDLKGIRKVKGDNITKQDVIADNVQVVLDQWNHVSFTISDVEETMSLTSLIDLYARPAAVALARMVDRMVLGQYPRFLPNMAGKLGGLSGQAVKDAILDMRKTMDNNKAYEEGRRIVLTTGTEADILRPEFFTSAEKVGDAGTALRTASLGHKLGFDFFKSLNMSQIVAGNTFRTFQINNAAGYNAGTTALTVNTGTGEITPGTWVSIGGYVYQVQARTGTAPTTAITLSYGLKVAAANSDPVIVITPGAVNFAAGYAKGYNKEIAVDVFTVAPQIGQLVSFGSDVTNVYTIIDTNGLVGITLDRSLDVAINDDDTVNIGPAGNYNLAFHRDAITLAIRGLKPVREGAGARSATLNNNGLSMRATIAYDKDLQEHVWTLDFLAGIQVIEKKLGGVLLG